MNINDPSISVVMSVYNAEEYLKDSIESILNQSFENFEFIIINDASTDSSMDIINGFQDSRIKLLNNDQNIGLTKSLNIGIKKSNGKYIARMDADDIARKKRLEIQFNFLEKNENIDFCGTWYIQFGVTDKKIKLPCNHDDILIKSFEQSPFCHPSVMIRSEFLNNNRLFYNEILPYGQDYELWIRLLRYGTGANIPRYLLLYRLHKGQVSTGYDYKQKETVKLVYKEILAYLLKNTFNENLWDIHCNFLFREFSQENFNFDILKEWKEILVFSNKNNNIYPEKKFIKTINKLEKKVCQRYYLMKYIMNPDHNNIVPFFLDKNSPFLHFSLLTILAFLLKSIRHNK